MFVTWLDLKVILLFILIFLLSSCTKAVESHRQMINQAAAPYTLPATAYLSMSKNQPSDKKQGLLIMAAGRLIYDGQWQDAERILTQLSNLSAAEQQEKLTLLARIDSIREQPQAAMASELQESPRQMAILLPLTGSLAGPGNAVRDGFMAAHHASMVSHDISVRIYDTASASADVLYQQAVADGAEYVVGPLLKNDVAKVANLYHPIPTLLLNDSDHVSNNAYRFGLSPANEASQVAVKAYKNGLRRALIIAPTGAWGDEVVAGFLTQWQRDGAYMADKFSYNDSTDLNQALRTFLHVSEKEARQKQFKAVVGQEVSHIPKRRQDFDMIFLLAYPSKARQIMPLLRYYFAGDVPVFATSAVYAGSMNTMRDKDLDGIIFCDMPWVFNHQLANKNWPEQWNSYSRLYALGMDSYALATQLTQLSSFPARGISNNSGVLYLNAAQQVGRELTWGKFKGGVARQTTDIL